MVTPWFGWESSPPSLETVRSDDLLDHADCETLLEPAELTTVPPPFVHRAIFVRQTNVLGVLLHCSLEESLTTFAGPNPVVLAGSVVSADGAQQGRRLWL